MTQSIPTQSPLATLSTYMLRRLLADARRDLDTVAVRLIDTELFYRQPVMTHYCDYGHWMATRGDYDLDCTVGTGSSEAEAIEVLLDLEADLRADEAAGIDYGMVEERARHP
jgi:hypothetical protein